MINDKQNQILRFVTDYINSKGFAPSIREIGEEMGFASPRAAQKHLEALEAEGYLQGARPRAPLRSSTTRSRPSPRPSPSPFSATSPPAPRSK